MVMITRGCEKKPQGVVSVTRGEFTVREVTGVTRYTLPRYGEAAALGSQAGFQATDSPALPVTSRRWPGKEVTLPLAAECSAQYLRDLFLLPSI